MKPLTTIRLNLWLPIIIAGIFIVMLSGFSIWHYHLKSDQLELRSIETIKNRMANLQHRIESLYRLKEEELVTEEIADYGSLDEIKYIALLDENGLVLNSSNPLWRLLSAKETIKEFNQSIFSQALAERQLIVKYNKKNQQLLAYQPINLATQPGKIRPTRVGVLVVDYSLISAKSLIWHETLLQSGIDLLIGFLTMGVLISVLRHWLSKPLHYLTDSAHRISQGDFTNRVEISGNGELVELAHAFNKMQEDLGNSILQLTNTAQALQANQENLAVTLDSIGDAVIITDAQGCITGMNPVAEKMTGWNLSLARGKPLSSVFNIVNSLTREIPPNPVNLVLESGNIVGLANHTSLISQHGHEYHIADSAAPIRNKTGQIDGVILVFHDVTEQYRKQAVIAAHEAELRKITNILPGPVSHVDIEGRYLFASAAYENWFGKQPQEIIGKLQQEVLGHELYGSLEPYFNRALQGISTSIDLALTYPTSGIREVIVNVIPDFDIHNKVSGYFTLVTDITERKLAEQTSQQLREQLSQANKMESVGHLTAGIAHDFNNILGAILGYTELAQHVLSNGSPNDPRPYLDEVVKASMRAKELILQMLTFSRLSPEVNAGPAPVILISSVLKEVVALLRSSIPSTIDINYQVDEEHLKSRIQGVNLHQIILNLGINARDAIGEYGNIDITLTKQNIIQQRCAACQADYQGNYVKLSIKDSGSGIASHHLQKIFDPFFTTKEVGKGTGMGLSVVHGLVHSAGGHIQVESEMGKSTTISILLPLVEEALIYNGTTEATAATTNQTNSSTLTGLRIMVVDDERIISAMLQEFLLISGAIPTPFNSPLDARAAFDANPEAFDFVITDETMPGLSGIHLAEHMLKRKPSLPIILCTGYSDNATPEISLHAGIAAFFYKPLNMPELLLKIGEVWRQKSA